MPQLSPPPDRTPFFDLRGRVTWPWIKWFQQMYLGVAGASDAPIFPIADEGGGGGADATSLAQSLAAAATVADSGASFDQMASFDDGPSPPTVFPFFVSDEVDHRWFADTHANRALYNANSYPAGSLYFETDRQILYVCRQNGATREWRYASGMFYTATAPATVATDAPALGTADVGVQINWTTYNRPYRWTGAAWARADAEPVGRIMTVTGVEAPGAGWQLCDGSAGVTVTTATGGTTTVTVPNYATSAYLKLATAATVGPTAASGVTADTTAVNNNTTAVNNNTTAVNNNTTAVNNNTTAVNQNTTLTLTTANFTAVGVAAVTGITNNPHTHIQDAHTHTQNAHTHTQNAHTHTQVAHTHTQVAHNHGPGTLELRQTVLVAYYRL